MDRDTFGPAVGEIARLLGQPFMPFQQQIADVGLELLPDGRPAYRQVTFTVPRQSGKTTLILAWEVHRALAWAKILGAPQRIAYSAQTGKDAREKLLEDQVPLLERNRHLIGMSKVTRTNGSESVLWKNGSRLSLLASGEQSGHGKTLDLAVKDELFADADMRRDQSLVPAMSTKPHAQMVTASTMGTTESIALNAEVASGRSAVERDTGQGIAYFEWSADPGDDPADPDVWWRVMPALGRTITLEVIEHAYDRLRETPDEFRRAYLNIPTASDERVIPASNWQSVCDPAAKTDADVFAFDCNPERSAAGIVAVGAGPTVEVVDYRRNTDWLIDRIVELSEKYQVPFAADKNGPASSFIDELVRKGVRIMEMDSPNVARAAVSFYDQVMDGAVTVRQNLDLDTAVAAAAKRSVGESWAWGRKSSKFDISLLVAASISLWAVQQTPVELEPFVSFI